MMMMMMMMLGNGVLTSRLGPSGQEFLISYHDGSQKQADEIGDATTLLLHRREGCLANSPSSLNLSMANKQYKGKMVGINRRAREVEIDNKLMNDIETNPGPRGNVTKAARARRWLKRTVHRNTTVMMPLFSAH